MKKKLWIPAAAVLAVLLLYIFGTGFMKSPSAFISDYAVSADGGEMTLRISVASSAGYVRKVAVHQNIGGKLYLDCYAAFGGVNGSLGARSGYTVPLSEDTEMIALYRGPDCYEEVLRKDAGGVWQRVREDGNGEH